MAVKSFSRGHLIHWDEEHQMWRYDDNSEPLPGWGGKERPCKKCGALFETGQPGACLGVLPGVDNACCGHGVPLESYIRFHNHVVVSGFVKTECCGSPDENALGISSSPAIGRLS